MLRLVGRAKTAQKLMECILKPGMLSEPVFSSIVNTADVK